MVLNKDGIQTTLGVSDQLVIPENAEGGIIGFSKSFIDAQGNNETLGPYFSSTQVTGEIQITKTNIQLSDYSNDYDVQVLLESDPFQYKWGGDLGTASNLTYSFSNHDTFTLDQSYTDSINTYTLSVSEILLKPSLVTQIINLKILLIPVRILLEMLLKNGLTERVLNLLKLMKLLGITEIFVYLCKISQPGAALIQYMIVQLDFHTCQVLTQSMMRLMEMFF